MWKAPLIYASLVIVAGLTSHSEAVNYVVDSTPLLNSNPANLATTEVGNISLAASRALIAAAHAANRGGTIDFQQQFQGGTFPNATASNNGIDVAAGAANALRVTTTSAPGPGGLVATGSPIFSFYRLESTSSGTAPGQEGTNNIDSNTNQGSNIISGGYKTRYPSAVSASNPFGDGVPIVGPVDFTGGIPTVDVGTATAGGSYMGITGQASPATLVFNNPLSFFGITAVPRGATRDTLLVLTLVDALGAVSTVQVGGGAQVVGTSAVYFGYLAPVGSSITRATLTNPNGQGPNRYDDLAFIVVPEPTSLAALAVGVTALRRRR